MILVLAGLALQVAGAATKPPAAVPAKPPAAAAAAVRPAQELRAMSQRYAPTVRGCYEREGLRRDPALSATLDVTVTIDSLGAVIQKTYKHLVIEKTIDEPILQHSWQS